MTDTPFVDVRINRELWEAFKQGCYAHGRQPAEELTRLLNDWEEIREVMDRQHGRAESPQEVTHDPQQG